MMSINIIKCQQALACNGCNSTAAEEFSFFLGSLVVVLSNKSNHISKIFKSTHQIALQPELRNKDQKLFSQNTHKWEAKKICMKEKFIFRKIFISLAFQRVKVARSNRKRKNNRRTKKIRENEENSYSRNARK